MCSLPSSNTECPCARCHGHALGLPSFRNHALNKLLWPGNDPVHDILLWQQKAKEDKIPKCAQPLCTFLRSAFKHALIAIFPIHLECKETLNSMIFRVLLGGYRQPSSPVQPPPKPRHGTLPQTWQFPVSLSHSLHPLARYSLISSTAGWSAFPWTPHKHTVGAQVCPVHSTEHNA